jgi:AraC-like DNA-binding protein
MDARVPLKAGNRGKSQMAELPTDDLSMFENAHGAEAMLRLRGWHIELIQLGYGQFRTIRVCSRVTGLEFIELHFGRAALLRGVSLLGHAALVFAHPSAPAFRVLSRPLRDGTCVMLGSGAPMDLYMPEDSRGCLVSIAVGGSNAVNAPARGVYEFRALSFELSSLLVSVLDSLREREGPSPPGVESASSHFFDERVLAVASQLLAHSAVLPPDAEEKAVRLRAVQRACRFIDAHLTERITLADMCEAAGARPRTLEYGFREFYDLGPMSFLRTLRLSRVRRELSRAPATTGSVTVSARRWHFSHMGQFSRDYRRLFGENPSATLARAQAAGTS